MDWTNPLHFCCCSHQQGVQFVDVREPWEHEEANLGPKFKLLPLSQASVWMSTVTKDLDPTKHTVCLCHHGVRSMQMATFLSNQGFEQVSGFFLACSVDRGCSLVSALSFQGISDLHRFTINTICCLFGTQVSNVVGGIDAYSKGVDSSVPEY